MFGLYMIFLQDGSIKQPYRHTDHILYICILFYFDMLYIFVLQWIYEMKINSVLFHSFLSIN